MIVSLSLTRWDFLDAGTVSVHLYTQLPVCCLTYNRHSENPCSVNTGGSVAHSLSLLMLSQNDLELKLLDNRTVQIYSFEILLLKHVFFPSC